MSKSETLLQADLFETPTLPETPLTCRFGGRRSLSDPALGPEQIQATLRGVQTADQAAETIRRLTREVVMRDLEGEAYPVREEKFGRPGQTLGSR